MIVSLEHLIPIIKKSLADGKPVRFTSTGSSMVPLVFNGDEIELIPSANNSQESAFNQNIKTGCIVLLEKDINHYVLHRIVKFEEELIYIRGDAQDKKEGPYNLKQIIGILKLSFHKGAERNHLAGFWHHAGNAWVLLFPFPVFVYRIYKSLRRLAAGTLRKLHIISPVRNG